ncbi:MAG TPA: ATP-binding protein [Polyangiaceae bacterium]|nr:ATP-binding protein [Polyangiaceae bacterium]
MSQGDLAADARATQSSSTQNDTPERVSDIVPTSPARRQRLLEQPGTVTHIVQFYEHDEFLAATVAHYIGSGFLAGEVVVVIATEAHRERFRRALQSSVFDVDRACESGQLILLDAAETLASFMVDDRPNWDLFLANVGAVIERASKQSHGQRFVRAYGGMVDVLWKQDKRAAALELEEMWNQLAQVHSFGRLCGYAMNSFSTQEHAAEFERIHLDHSQVLPSEEYSALGTDEERSRRIMLLEQHATALENEIRRRKALENALRDALGSAKQSQEELCEYVEKLAEQNRINSNLARIASALSSELELEVLIQRLTDEATAICRAQFGAFFYNVVNDKGESYTLYALSGAHREAFSKFPMPRNTGIFEPTFSGRCVVRLDDVTQDPRYGKSAPYHGMPQGHLPVRSYLAVPVKSRSGEVLGGLFFGHAELGVFSEADERLQVAVAAQAGIAIDNAKFLRAAVRAEEQAQREREKLEAIACELENANRTKDEFLATVSHELRTPLNAILGWVRMLRCGSLPAEKHERALEIIERNANSQTRLIEDLLDVSRIVSGKLRLDVQTVDLEMVVENAVEAVRPAATARNVSLLQTIDPNAGPILADPGRLQQVVWNLLTNAVKFTPRGGRIVLAVRKRDSFVDIGVSDNGQGIEPEFLTKIFERFRQADATTTRKYGGLGLGLSIVRHLVELHGGTVHVESEGEGKGAAFTVCLPISPLRSTSLERPPALRFGAPQTSLRGLQDLEGLRVLVVDDEPDARDVLSEMLGTCKAKVVTASSAAEALRLLQEMRPDIVVSDIGMPGEDGYALIQKLRSLPESAGGRTPAVALTAYARFEDRTKALIAGFNMHVPKPVELGELTAVLSSLTRMFSARQS